MSIKSYFSISTLINALLTSVVFADAPELSTLSLIEKGVNELRQVITPGIVCKNQIEKTCSFKDLCKEFIGNETKETLYENELGERVVNGQFIFVGQQLNNCKLGVEENAKKLISKKSAVKLRRTLYEQAKSLNATDDLIQFELTLDQFMADIPNKKEGYTPQQWITLMKVLAHEISHSIDPCNVLMVPEIKRKSGSICSPQGCVSDPFKDPLERVRPIQRNPFAKTIACLKQKNSVWAMSSDDHVLERHERAREYLKDLDQAETLVDFENHIQSEKVMKDKFCKTDRGNSQLGEAFSDWVSAEVIGEKIAQIERKDPKSAVKRAKEALMVFPTSHCPNLKKPLNDLKKRINADFGCQKIPSEVEFLESLEDPHPYATARINKIFLAQPQIKSVLKCSDDPGVIHCENKK